MEAMTEQGWGRGRLITILATAVVVALALLAGLGYTMLRALGASGGNGEGSSAPHSWQVVVDLPADRPVNRGQIASTPMLQAAPQDARQGTVSLTPAATITVPAPTRTGAVDVPTGMPQTPEGAVAQLAAIDTTVLQAMSIPATHAIHRAWSTGGDPGDWVMTQNVQAFLTSAQQTGQAKESGLAVVATPAAGQVKGTDRRDWVLACVLLDVRAVLTEEARIAYGHCEAMTWEQDRWVIDASHAPAPAPSTWPGTDLAARAGWRTWLPTGAATD